MVWKGSNAMNAEYNQLITETFCDNAIRSVMMIDDDYTPYHELVKISAEATNLSQVKEALKQSARASTMQKFFEDKKFICDVSDGLESFDADKARKSDLLILDYQLKNDAPELSLSILKKLSQTKHMNLVVIYTSENLEKVWLEIAATMNGYYKMDIEDSISNVDFKDIWCKRTDDGDELPEEWNHFVEDDIAQFLKGNLPSFKEFSKKIPKGDKRYTRDIYCSSLAMKAQKYDKLKEDYMSVEIQGSFNGNLWLKFGNVFIALHNKVDDEPASEIWESLTTSLIDWQPNYFRLISSEIQNQIENGAATLNKYLSDDYYSQAASLWQVLKNWDNKEIELRKLLENNTDSFKDNIILSKAVLDFSERVCNQFHVGFPKPANEKDNKDNEQINFVVRHASKNLNVNDQTLPVKVVHSLNCSLSTKDFTSSHITTGTILFCEIDNIWLLCVTPACDTVPEQNNTCLSKRLAPNFKLLKFIRLEPIKLISALNNATDGTYFFLENNVTLQTSSNPNLEYAITHIKENTNNEFNLTIFKSKNDETKDKEEIKLEDDEVLPIIRNFEVKAQLKDSYAARYQALASHHVGRIGVDYVKYTS
jgi:hypothetical protein